MEWRANCVALMGGDFFPGASDFYLLGDPQSAEITVTCEWSTACTDRNDGGRRTEDPFQGIEGWAGSDFPPTLSVLSTKLITTPQSPQEGRGCAQEIGADLAFPNAHRRKTCCSKARKRTGRARRQKYGWGGWTRTNTIRINSAVSYRLDHAPAGATIVLSGGSL